ncbi:hypothetical protein D9M70_573690 [compost metagenome]
MAMSRSFGWAPRMERSPMRMSPPLGSASPAMMLSRVDLPQPDGPSSARNSPLSRSMSMPFSVSTSP